MAALVVHVQTYNYLLLNMYVVSIIIYVWCMNFLVAGVYMCLYLSHADSKAAVLRFDNIR